MTEEKWIKVQGFPAESLLQELERKDALIAELVEALKSMHFYIAASNEELETANITRREALQNASNALSTARALLECYESETP